MQSFASAIRVYFTLKMILLFFLGFSSGLPLLLVNSTLIAWLTEAGLSKELIGLFALLNLPYSFKFLWSPLLDRFIPSLPGSLSNSRRRGWLVLCQLLLMLSIGFLGFQDPNQNWLSHFELGHLDIWSRPIFVIGFVTAFLAATQDIAVDAYRTDILTEPEMGAGVATFVTGYRVALLVSGGIALVLADSFSWRSVYLMMSSLFIIGIIASYFAPEPSESSQSPTSLQIAIIEPFRSFFHQRSLLQSVLILSFIILYKLSDGLAGQMTTPFLLETGFSKTDLGTIRSGLGLLATLAGGFIGGGIMSVYGIYRSLFLFGILQGISNLGFAGLALIGNSLPGLSAAILLENITGGMGTAAFLAFLMSLCHKEFSATQYALLSSLFAVGGTFSGSISGYLAELLNWIPFFCLTSLGALPSLGLLLLIKPPTPFDKVDPV
jgi:PAT family beta-lactamase induction signal transducer AmpG